MEAETDLYITSGKRYVELGNLTALQETFQALKNEEGIDWPTLFQKVYLHACLKGRKEIAEWMEKTAFPTLDPIAQIALRQSFAYGRHLLATAERRRNQRG